MEENGISSTNNKVPFWTPTNITLAVIAGVLLVPSVVVVVALICRHANYKKRREALGALNTTQKLAEPKLEEKKVSAPETAEPYVTEPKLTATCEKYYAKVKRYVSDKLRDVKDFVIKCQDEPPPVKTPDMRGRRQNNVRAFQFECAVLYQMCHKGCSKRNACFKSFVKYRGGYASARSTYDYWGEHPVEADETYKSLSTAAAGRNMTIQKYYEARLNEMKPKLREIKA